MEERRGAFSFSLGKSEGKRPCERPRRRWKYIKLYLQGVRWGGIDWIYLSQDISRWRAVLNAIMNLRVL
jgi:hypothetical protein